MPYDYPPNPNVGDSITGGDGQQLEWDGEKWKWVGGGGGGPFLPLAGGYMAGPIYGLSAEFTFDLTVGGTLTANDITVSGDFTIPPGGTIDVPTPPQDDRSSAIATTEFVMRQLDGFSAIPIGGMIIWTGDAEPPDFLFCDGSWYPTDVVPKLAAEIGYRYGGDPAWGSGVGAIAVPNAVNRMIVGAGTPNAAGTYALADTGGAAVHTLTTDEMPNHAHVMWDGTHNHGFVDPTHVHGLTDPGHVHGIGDPGHAHGVADPTHQHPLSGGVFGYGIGIQVPPSPMVNSANAWTQHAAIGAGIYGAGTGIWTGGAGTGRVLQGNYTGCYPQAAGANVATYAQGNSWPHENMPPYLALHLCIRYQ